MLGELCQPTGAGPELFHKFIMNASVEMSKSNRRKQSKPNRLFADEDGAATPMLNVDSQQSRPSPGASPKQLLEDDVVHVTEPNEDKAPIDLSTKVAEHPSSQSPKSAGSVEMPPTRSISPQTQLEMVNFPCHTCGEMFPSRAKQEQHISERHSRETPPKVKSSPSGSMFPTAYHQLATELGIAPGLGLPSSKASTEPTKTSPNSSSGAGNGGVPNLGTPGVGGKGSAGTVFQREAYCEICQREFCNKYFLKTHKANIHGIVDPSDPKAVAALAKVNQSPKVNNISPNMESTPVMPQLHQPQLHHLQSQQHQPQQQQQHKAPSQSSSGQKVSSNETMEDFCEICQKHFCNKYYLKKHKMDVHNIRPDGSKSQPSGENLLDGRNSLPQVPPSSNPAGMPHLPMMIPSLNNLNPTSMNNMLFVNPFVPSMAAMSMVPPMMQPQFFMPGMGNLAAAHAASQALTSNISPEIKSEQKPPLSVSNLERGESLADGDKAEAFCNICRKEFCNSYFLQIHKANKHGIFDDVAASAALMLSMAGQTGPVLDPKELQGEGQSLKMARNMSTSPASSTASNNIRPVVLKSEKERNQTSPAFSLQSGLSSRLDSNQPMLPSSLSFDAMLAAKQADRIMCDICNKEVCNKYFLKAHKLKMHGISSTDDKMTTPNKDSKRELDSGSMAAMPPLSMHQSLVHNQQKLQQSRQQQALQQEIQKQVQKQVQSDAHLQNIMQQQQQSSLQQAQRSSPTPSEVQNMLKLGIDPEAYCFICKQEFCNKYFLKAHKINVHGGKGDDSSSQQQRTTPKGTITPPTSVSPKSAASPAYAPSAPTMAADTFQWKWKDSTHGKIPVSEGSTNGTTSDRFTWRWKEPANATRVFCDICNKELCNKYFLRTHKLNKHGIREASESSPGKPAESGMLASSVMADLARASQASQQSKRAGSTGSRRHSPSSLTTSPSPTEMDQQAAMCDDVCQICGMVFANLMAVNEHIKAEHSDENFEAPHAKASRVSNKKSFNCPQCPYKTSVWENLRSHQARKHDAEMNTCQTCNLTFGHVNKLIEHMSDIHHKEVTLAHLQEKSQAGRALSRKQIKCNYCPEKFTTKSMRRSHMRALHKDKSSATLCRMNDKTKKISHTRVYSCDKCSYTCGSMRNLKFHQAMKHKKRAVIEVSGKRKSNGVSTNSIMQKFTISSVSGELSLARSTIMLPVCQRIPAESTVSLTLVPSKCI